MRNFSYLSLDLINETIMPYIKLGATIETCSFDQKTGECKSNGCQNFENYFYGLWRKAGRCSNMKIEFSKFRVVENQPASGRAKVEFLQKYQSCWYKDNTEKILKSL